MSRCRRDLKWACLAVAMAGLLSGCAGSSPAKAKDSDGLAAASLAATMPATRAATRPAEPGPELMKDPVRFLDLCEEEIQRATMKCAASRIATAQKQAQAEAVLKEQEQMIKLGREAFDDLKVVYRKAEAQNDWPVTWRERQLDKASAKQQIVRFATEIRRKAELVENCRAYTVQSSARMGKLADTKTDLNDLLTTVAAQREILKIQSITPQMQETLLQIKRDVRKVTDDLAKEPLLDGPKAPVNVTPADFDDVMKK